MRDIFPEHFTPSKEEFAVFWQNATFAFDSGGLLALYRTSPKTRGTYLDILRHFEERLWLPHQAGLEFLRNRPAVMESQIAAYRNFKGIVENISKYRQEAENNKHNQLLKYEVLSSTLDNCYKLLQESFCEDSDVSTYETNCAATHAELERLFANRTGRAPADISAREKQLEKRYQELQPPGYMDQKKEKDREKEVANPSGIVPGNQFGDGCSITSSLTPKATQSSVAMTGETMRVPSVVFQMLLAEFLFGVLMQTNDKINPTPSRVLLRCTI